jgi:hypothetical protein
MHRICYIHIKTRGMKWYLLAWNCHVDETEELLMNPNRKKRYSQGR